MYLLKLFNEAMFYW